MKRVPQFAAYVPRGDRVRQSTDLLDLKSGDPAEGANPSLSAMLERRWAAGLLVVLCTLVGPGPGDASAQEPIPELVPAGWTMRTSANSIYFTRPDIPNVQVGFVNDLRPGLSQDQKFEAAKAFFAERAGCPALASAETEKSFGAYTAFDDAQAPRCFLTAMGHWREGGLQVSLILNETPDAGPKPGDGVFEAILEDILQYSMFRYEVGDQEVEVNLPPEAYAKGVDPDHKPVRILSFVDESAPFLRAITAIEIMNLEPGDPIPRRDESFRPLLLFAGSGTGSEQLGSLCTDWDPGLFSPAAILTYHATNRCFRFDAHVVLDRGDQRLAVRGSTSRGRLIPFTWTGRSSNADVTSSPGISRNPTSTRSLRSAGSVVLVPAGHVLG